VVNGTVGGCRSVTTLASQSVPPVPSAVYGRLRTNNCSTNVSGSLVEVAVNKVGGSASLIYATITTNAGTWALPFGVAAMSNGTYASPALGDTIALTAVAPGNKSAAMNLSYNGKAQLVGPETLCTTTYS
jgi:hypothetical protein